MPDLIRNGISGKSGKKACVFSPDEISEIRPIEKIDWKGSYQVVSPNDLVLVFKWDGADTHISLSRYLGGRSEIVCAFPYNQDPPDSCGPVVKILFEHMTWILKWLTPQRKGPVRLPDNVIRFTEYNRENKTWLKNLG